MFYFKKIALSKKIHILDGVFLSLDVNKMAQTNEELMKNYQQLLQFVRNSINKAEMELKVPVNYSSKTKLIPGDVLKLKILADGKFIYKLIKPAERKHLRAVLSKSDENKYTANTEDGKVYFLNQAAVSFYLGNPGDELYVIVNENGEGNFAAIEAIIKK